MPRNDRKRIDVIAAGLPEYSMEKCQEMLEDKRDGVLRLFLISQGHSITNTNRKARIRIGPKARAASGGK